MSNPVALFVGGTGGIGAALAVRFAKSYPKGELIIVGRNEVAASKVLDRIKAQNDQIQSSFVKLNCDDLAAVRNFCTDFRETHSQLNHLCLSAGILKLSCDPSPAEGIDRKLILHYYSRMLFCAGLLPLIQQSKATAPPCVLNVLAAGDEGTVNWSDLPLKQPGSWSLRYCANHAVTLTSLMTQELGEKYPDIRWTHAHPGVVSTWLEKDLPWYFKPGLTAASLFVSSPESSAERLVHHLLQPAADSNEKPKSGPFYFSLRGKEIKTSGSWLTEQNRQMARADLLSIIGSDPTNIQ